MMTQIKLLVGLFTFCNFLSAAEYPLIDRIEVSKNRISVTPNEHIRNKYLRDGDHSIFYNDPEIDLTQYDESILIMPFIFDVLGLIFISGDIYYVDELDEEVFKSLNQIKNAYKQLYPAIDWDGEIRCNKTTQHFFTLPSSKTLTLFSGGVDSTYSALKNTHAMFTKLNVKNHAIGLKSFNPYEVQSRCITRAKPCKNPQNTNVQPAPCQKPPIRKVSIMFT